MIKDNLWLALLIYVVITIVFAVLVGRVVAKANAEGALKELSDAVGGLKAAVKSAAKKDWERIRSFVRRFTD